MICWYNINASGINVLSIWYVDYTATIIKNIKLSLKHTFVT